MEIKSKLVRCPAGHNYNAAVHNACPICGSPAAMAVEVSPGGFAPTEAPGAGYGGGGFAPTEAPGGGYGGGGFAPTEAPGGGYGGGGFAPTEAPGGGYGSGGFAPTEAPGFVSSGSRSGGKPSGGVNPFSVQTTIGGDLTVQGKTNPVVGWLVCIEGPSRGTDWRIHAGYNYIGRETGDIHIQGDNQISREKHAMVAFYAKNMTYYVGPADGRNIIELNGDPVFTATQLKNYDVITLGNTKLLFVGLCGSHFSWGKDDNG